MHLDELHVEESVNVAVEDVHRSDASLCYMMMRMSGYHDPSDARHVNIK